MTVYTEHEMPPSPDPNGAPGHGFDRITHDPAVMGGRACLRGLRITVALVVDLVADGLSAEELLREYPDLERGDVRQALRCAASLAGEEVRPLVAGAPWGSWPTWASPRRSPPRCAPAATTSPAPASGG